MRAGLLVVALALLAAAEIPAAGDWALGGVFRDSALEVSPDGRFAVVSVRRVDTDGDGRLAAPDLKSLLLLEEGREVYCFGEGAFAYRDRMARWSPDGERLALAAPGAAPGWTPWDASDVVVFDPRARTEMARYTDGINPVWLWDGLLAFQRADRILIVDGDRLTELDPAALAGGEQARLRTVVADPDRRRLIVSFAHRSGPEDRAQGVLVEVAPVDGDWALRRLPFEGHAPLPTADGLYAFRPRGDVNGSGRYEVSLDGVDLLLDGEPVIEDAVFHGLFDLGGVRLALARRGGGFEVQRVNGGDAVAVTAGLAVDGATVFARHEERVVLAARLEPDGGTALYRWAADGDLTQLAPAPALRPQPRSGGLYYLRVDGAGSGSLVFCTWPDGT